MNCDCGEEMEYMCCYDSGSSGENVAYNLYHCDLCGTVKIEHVWNNPRVITIDINFEKKD